MDNQKYILKYLHGELTDHEYQEFMSLIQSDSDFAQDVEIESVLYAKHKNILKQQILEHSNLDKNVDQEPETKQLPNGRFIGFIRKAAAILIIGGSVFCLYYSLTTNIQSSTLADTYISNVHNPPHSLMGKEELDNGRWEIGIESYKHKKYELAIDQISKIENKTNEQLLYLALSKLYLEDIPSSIIDLELILNSSNNLHKDEAQWFLGLAYIKNNELGKAKIILNKIVSSKSWNNKDALTLLENLNQ